MTNVFKMLKFCNVHSYISLQECLRSCDPLADVFQRIKDVFKAYFLLTNCSSCIYWLSCYQASAELNDMHARIQPFDSGALEMECIYSG